MLAILPLLGYLGFVAVLRQRWPEADWRLTALQSAMLWSVTAVLGSELLSLIHGITPIGLALIWAIVVALTLPSIWRVVRMKPWLALRGHIGTRDPVHRVAILGCLAIVVVVFFVGLLAAPNTWDSLTTHMSRVAHWANHRSLEHYATGIELQNYYPPLPGMAVLQFYVLQPGDLLAFLPQWVAMALSIAGVSYLAARLGAGRPGQAMAAIFAATLPAGISQASGTMTDYLAGLWALIVVVELVELRHDGTHLRNVLFLSTAAGLAVLTKPTVFPILVIAAGAAAFFIYRQARPRQWAIAAVTAILIVLVLNAGYFVRNQQTYGHPLGLRRNIDVHAIGGFSPAAVTSNVLRNLSLHLGTPSPHVNKAIYLSIQAVHDVLGLDVSDESTSVHTTFKIRIPSRHETKAGNLLHTLAVPLLFIGAWRTRKSQRGTLALLLGVTLAFVGFSALFKFSTFGARYHLPYFLLVAPAAGVLAERWLQPQLALALSLCFVVFSLPWVLAVESRPIISFPGDSPSLLVSSRDSTYFAYNPGLERTYVGMTSRLRGEGCQDVGIILHGSTAEYPLWPLLGAPASSVDINWIVADTPSARYMTPDYQPCAVICQFCDEDSIRSLPKVEDRAGYQLYLVDGSESIQ